VQSQQLLPQGEVLQDEALSGSQRSGQPAEEVPKQHSHVEKCTGSLSNGQIAKLLNVAHARGFGEGQRFWPAIYGYKDQ
jgi:hypothetical protein